jgi:hypothetical protein
MKTQLALLVVNPAATRVGVSKPHLYNIARVSSVTPIIRTSVHDGNYKAFFTLETLYREFIPE